MLARSSSRSNPYRSYLLRLWRVETGGGTMWRASLETVGTGARHGFAQLQDLYAFLEAEVQGNDTNPPRPSQAE